MNLYKKNSFRKNLLEGIDLKLKLKLIVTIDDKIRDEKDFITNQKNQNERLVGLTNEDDHKDNYTEIFEKLLKKERFDEIIELTNEMNQNDLTYFFYFEGNTATERFNDFNNGIELFKKIKSGQMKLEEEKNTTKCVWIKSKRKIKRKIQIRRVKKCIRKIKLLYKWQEGVSKLINDYYSIASEANNKTIHGKEILGM